jgi:hypothetical protein
MRPGAEPFSVRFKDVVRVETPLPHYVVTVNDGKTGGRKVLVDVELGDVMRELWPELGDGGVRKAAYRGGCRACQNLPERSDTPCREIPLSSPSVSLTLSMIP